MPAITIFAINSDGCEYQRGSLVSLPPELSTPAQSEAYRAASLGWSFCPLGYSIYKFTVFDGQIVIPGVRLQQTRKPKRIVAGYKCEYEKRAIEALADEIRDGANLVEERAAELIAKLTHDLRKVSSQIINFVELLKVSLVDQRYGQSRVQAENIAASQQVLSLRLDMMDYTTGLAFEVPGEAVPVYKKFDKIAKMFESGAQVNEVTLRLEGPSNGYTMGPPVFELVPFVLIENAVKYSPRRGPIEIKITDFPNHIDAHVRSFGPRIERAEASRVFEQGFRGSHAISSGKSGSGIGLHAAHSLITGAFDGQLWVHQETASINMDGSTVWGTTFSLRVPRVS